MSNHSVALRALTYLIRERTNQVGHGFTPEHDDEHDQGELALHAALYAAPVSLKQEGRDPWLWDKDWDKRGPKHPGPTSSDPMQYLDSRLSELVKAGGLVLAEIERILRIKEGRVGS